MNIRKLYIRDFGKLHDFEIDLSKGINIIYGPNESGKSTIMAFIKAVLYGLKGGRADKDGLASELKRYKPWNSERYGGYISLELDNSASFRLDRDFGSSNVTLFDQDFNDITGHFSGTKDGKGIAEKLLGVNECLFERTVYVKQLGTKIDTTASKELIDRLSNLQQSGYEDISYRKASAVLKEALKQQVGTDRSYTRPLDIINRRLSELSALRAKIQEVGDSLRTAQEKQLRLTGDIELLISKERLAALGIEFRELKEKLDIRKSKSEEIRFLNEGARLTQKNIDRLNDDKAAIELEANQVILQETQLVNDLSQLQKPDVGMDMQREKTLIKYSELVGIISLLALAGSIIGSFLLNKLPVFTVLIPALIFTLSFIIRTGNGRKFKESEGEQNQRLKNLELTKQKLENTLRVKEVLNNQLVGLNERLALEKAQLDQQIKRLESVSLNFRIVDFKSLEQEVDEISVKIMNMLEELGSELTSAETSLIENVLDNPAESLTQDLSQLRAMYLEQLQQKRIEKAALDIQLQKDGSELDAEAVEQELYKLTQQKKNLEQRGEALQIAMKTLEEASCEVQKKILPVMSKVFSSTFSGFTARKYTDTRAGDNLNIMLSDPASETVIPVSALSNGTMDQLYLALRIAIHETVFKGSEGLPLIMDEPFAQYDDQRTINALNCIGELAKNQQIIIFTCKQREVELISSMDDTGLCKICSLT